MWTVGRPALVSIKLLLVAWYCSHMHSPRQLLVEGAGSIVTHYVLLLLATIHPAHVLCWAAVAALSTTLSTAALDKHPQSKERGITLDLGFSAFTVSAGKVPCVLTQQHVHVAAGLSSVRPTSSTPTCSCGCTGRNYTSHRAAGPSWLTLYDLKAVLAFVCLTLSAVQVPAPEQLQQLGHDALQFTLVDCPGHASLIRTIIGGAQIIDTMILVIDVTKGTAVMAAAAVAASWVHCGC